MTKLLCGSLLLLLTSCWISCKEEAQNESKQKDELVNFNMERLEKKLGAPRLTVALCMQTFKKALDFTFFCRLVELTDQAEKTGVTDALA